MEEIQIVVERVGYGSRKWRWRLANECGLTIGLGAGFSGPESAYASAQQRLLDLRTGMGPDLVSAPTAQAPVERKKRGAWTGSSRRKPSQELRWSTNLQQSEEPPAAPEFIPHFTRAKSLLCVGS